MLFDHRLVRSSRIINKVLKSLYYFAFKFTIISGSLKKKRLYVRFPIDLVIEISWYLKPHDRSANEQKFTLDTCTHKENLPQGKKEIVE